jgi:glucans biosynthesis protein C
MPSNPQRNYAYDHLKTTMMIGVVVLHSALSYMVINPGKIWPSKDPYTTSLFFDVLAAYLQYITMPVFFVISGCLTAMLVEKQGIKKMIKNRIDRILYPLIIGMLTLVPLSAGAFYYFDFTVLNVQSPFASALTQLNNEGFGLLDFKLIHLWFLYCLVIFCFVGAIVNVFMPKLLPAVTVKIDGAFSRVYNMKIAPLVLAIPTFILLALRSQSILETPVTLLTNFSMLLSYAVFFVFGWLLFYQKNILRFKKGAVFFGILGLCFFVAKLMVYDKWGETYTTQYILAALHALFVWCMVFAHIGLYLRYFNTYSRLGRYLSDASYWIYLMHLPIVLVLQALLIHSGLNAYTKFVVVIAVTFLITITMYNYLVRDTFIGSFLNGKKYKRGLPN